MLAAAATFTRAFCARYGNREAVERVARIVLAREVFTRFPKSDRRKPELVVRRVVAAPVEPIGPPQQPHPVRRHVARGPTLHESRELTRRRILRPFGVHTDRRAVDDAVTALVVADDVVVEDCVDPDAIGGRFLRVQMRAKQSLLLGDMTHEHQRGVEVDAALTEDAGQLHRQRRAAAVVVHPGAGRSLGASGSEGCAILAGPRPALLDDCPPSMAIVS